MTNQKRSRILALDLLRGAFLMAIIVDHLGWGPSLFHLVTGGGRMFASPAEGFFAISGILVGYIYGPRIARSFTATLSKLWKRAGLLWSLSVVSTLVFTALAVSFPHLTGLPPLWERSADSFLINTLLGRYAYGWADFLPRYAVFMLAAPFILWLIAKGKAWVVALGSVGIYVLFAKTALFLPFSAWEIIFVPSIIVGYYLPTIEKSCLSLRPALQTHLLAGVWASAVMTFCVSSAVFILFPMLGVSYPALDALVAHIAPYFDKETVAIGRLALGTLWFVALYSFVRIHETRIHRYSLGILEVFGTKSLYTYCIHAVVVFILATLAPVDGATTIVDSTLIAGMVLVLMYVLVRSPAISQFTHLDLYRTALQRLLRYNREYESSRVRS